MVRPLPPYSSGISAARKPALVSACDELGRIGALAIDLAPVFAGEFRAQRAHRLADRRKLGVAGGVFAHAVTSARPLFIATTLRSGTERAEAHDIAVAPHLGADGLARKHRRGKAPGERAHARADRSRRRFSAAHGRPRRRCRARAGSGADSPRPWPPRDRRAADCGRRTADRSAPAPAACRDRRRDRARARESCATGGLSRGGPPKPPSARQNVVCVTVAISSPLALSVTLRSV